MNWIIDHENDPDIDQMPLVCYTFDIFLFNDYSIFNANFSYPI